MTADLELTLLGTSSPLHAPHRFGPAQIVRGGDATVLIDCGWGATPRLYQAAPGPPRLPPPPAPPSPPPPPPPTRPTWGTSCPCAGPAAPPPPCRSTGRRVPPTWWK